MFGEHHGEVVVGGLAVAVGGAVGLLVRIEGEGPVQPTGQYPAHDVMGVAIVAAPKQLRSARQAALLLASQATRRPVGAEEILLRLAGGEQVDDQDAEQERSDRRQGADRDTGDQGADDERRDRQGRAEAERHGALEEPLEVDAPRVVSVLGDWRLDGRRCRGLGQFRGS
jgi:hypothetical protein